MQQGYLYYGYRFRSVGLGAAVPVQHAGVEDHRRRIECVVEEKYNGDNSSYPIDQFVTYPVFVLALILLVALVLGSSSGSSLTAVAATLLLDLAPLDPAAAPVGAATLPLDLETFSFTIASDSAPPIGPGPDPEPPPLPEAAGVEFSLFRPPPTALGAVAGVFRVVRALVAIGAGVFNVLPAVRPPR